MNIYLDIETIPTSDPAIIEELASSVKPPATHKKQETIDLWLRDNKEQAVSELVAKTSFDGLHGRIACIAWAFDDEDVESTESWQTERQAIQLFYDAIAERTSIVYSGGRAQESSTFVGHNITGFDLPFLKHRSIILNVKPDTIMRRAFAAKPWDKEVADTMLIWSADRDKRVSMDKLCKAFGIAGKGEFNGSMVAETWPINPQKVIDYCKDDITRTRLIFKRLNWI